ncbi:MAG TPA: glycosyltransferase family 2 protein [Pseudomonas sp.]|nr:glycosyltransferase family 2 protein [Pseudomonas sp.]
MVRSGIALIIPAYNEAATIYAVVKSASRYGQPIVIDDCSTDATAELAERAGAVVVRHASNRGYDGALNTGFAEADRREFESIITLDADGQHDPELLSRFIDGLDQGADLVLGVRDRFPRCAERIFALYTRRRYGVHDPLCGMKAYRRSVYQRLGHFDSYKSIGTELALFGVKNNFSFCEIAFVVRDRQDSPRFGRLLSANLRILRAMMRDLFRA